MRRRSCARAAGSLSCGWSDAIRRNQAQSDALRGRLSCGWSNHSASRWILWWLDLRAQPVDLDLARPGDAVREIRCYTELKPSL